MLSQKELRESLGEEARRYARTWSAQAMARRMLDLYREVILEHSEAPATVARYVRT